MEKMSFPASEVSFYSYGGGEYGADGVAIKIVFGFASMQNPNREHDMEDFVSVDLKEVDGNQVAFFGVFDGHRGADTAMLLERSLFDVILQEGGLWADPAGATRDGFLAMDREICERVTLSTTGTLSSGAVAVTAMVILDKGRMIVANLGDARAVLFGPGQVRQLSKDHVPDRPVERGSVEAKGGQITTLPGDKPRVDGAVKVTRSFGDREFKGHLSAKPDIRDMDIELSSHEGLLLMSDGIWRTLGNERSVEIVQMERNPKLASEKLIKEALQSGLADDASCAVLRFDESD